MRLILFGASGMVGAGALREALAAPEVSHVLSVGRRPCGVEHPKLRELLLPDLFDFGSVESDLKDLDGCIWAAGISSLGLDEAAYAKVTEELTLVWARALLRLSPGISFSYCSAAGADGSSMWARVRQRLEKTLKEMPFRHVGVVRPAIIRPGPGIKSRTLFYQMGITLLTPFFPVLVRGVPAYFTTSERLGRAMLRIVQGRAGQFVLESQDINRVGDG